MEQAKNENYFYTIITYAPILSFFCLIVGFLLHTFFSDTLFSETSYTTFGEIPIIIGTFLIVWAQKSAKRIRLHTPTSPLSFQVGPYAYMRHPTYFGLTLLSLGVAILMNSWIVFIMVFLQYILMKMISHKEEEILIEKYQDNFTQYQKAVKRFF